jgi:hypothetical protein
MAILLSPEILRWIPQYCGWIPAPSRLGRLAKNEWDHGNFRLSSVAENGQDREEDRKDAIAALWRAVERRLQLFDEVYNIRRLLGINRRSKIHLGHLQELGLIRGSVLDDIRRLRNAIEHDSGAPPERKQCLLYQDAIWYFLRSTEGYTRGIPNTYELIEDLEKYANGETEERVEIRMHPPEWSIGIFCERLSPDHYAMTSRDDWIPIDFPGDINAGLDGVAHIMGSITDPAWTLEFAKTYFSCI